MPLLMIGLLSPDDEGDDAFCKVIEVSAVMLLFS
jgi:hypothetical protein